MENCCKKTETRETTTMNCTIEKDGPYEVSIYDHKKEWRLNGKLHRDNDLPAIIWKDGQKEWWFKGKIHRDNDLPAAEYANGDKFWLQHGHYHRENGPAIQSHSREEWWLDDKEYTEQNWTVEMRRRKLKKLLQ